MTNHGVQTKAGRKAGLLLEGANFRAGFVQSKSAVILGLRPESLMHSAVEQVAGLSGARLVASLLPNGFRFKALMPVAIAALSFLFRQRLRNLAVGAGLIAATATVLTLRRRRARTTDGKQSGD